MRILFVLEHYYPYIGGSEELFRRLTGALAGEGFSITVITTRHDPSLDRLENINGVRIRRVNCRNRYLFALFSIPVAIRYAGRADLIHTTTYASAIPAFLAGKLTGRKVVINFHEVWGRLWQQLPFMPRWKLTAFRYFEKLVLKLPFYKYIAVSGHTRNALLDHGVPPGKVEMIYNGLNYDELRRYRHAPPEHFTYCFFGRLGISKGLDLLLEASLVFSRRFPEARLKLIIPTYPAGLYKKVVSFIEANRMEAYVILLHDLSREDLLKEVAASSCAVIPSYSEGFCFAAAECAAMGVPVISSGKGSLPEVASGKLIRVDKMDPDHWTAALERAYNGEWESEALKRFAFSESLEKYLRLYRSIFLPTAAADA